MLRRNKTVWYFYISNRKEKIVIDSSVSAVIKILDEIIDAEKSPWIKKILTEIRNGIPDIQIIRNNPIEKTKYYSLKKALKEKIYQCCISKGMVSYDDILNTRID